MPPPYSYDWWQNLWPAVFGAGWRAPNADPTRDRYLDHTLVQASVPFDWAPELRNAKLTVGNTTTPWDKSITGIPVQRVAKNAPKVTVTVNDTYRGEMRRTAVPRPPGGFWIEGNPNPYGAWDTHVIVVCPETGEAWELIGFTEATTMALGCAHYQNGKLIEGYPVCAANVPMTPLLSAVGDGPHRRGLVLTNYVGADGDKKAGTGWPGCGDVLRLTETSHKRLLLGATAEQRVLIDDLRISGAKVYDRGGVAGLGCVAGADWARSTLPKIPLVHGDFELVVA